LTTCRFRLVPQKAWESDLEECVLRPQNKLLTAFLPSREQPTDAAINSTQTSGHVRTWLPPKLSWVEHQLPEIRHRFQVSIQRPHKQPTSLTSCLGMECRYIALSSTTRALYTVLPPNWIRSPVFGLDLYVRPMQPRDRRVPYSRTRYSHKWWHTHTHDAIKDSSA
jgi:hypothetical protein